MPDAEEMPQRFELRSAPLRLGVRALRVAAAWYVSGAVILTALAAWSASRPADAAAAVLIALSAVQVDYFAAVAVVRLRQVGRDLRRVGTPAGRRARPRGGADRARADRLAPGGEGRGGLGRLLLTPDYLKLPGTDVPVPWSHVQGVTVVRGRRPGLDAVVACPDPDPAPDCKLRGRRSPFHIAESLYYTTADDIGAAFARYTDVDRSETRP